MEFKIGDNFRIVAWDKYNFDLEKWTTTISKKTKEEKKQWITVGHFPRLDHALQRVLQENLRSLDEANVQLIIDTIKQTDKRITERFKGVKIVKVAEREKRDET